MNFYSWISFYFTQVGIEFKDEFIVQVNGEDYLATYQDVVEEFLKFNSQQQDVVKDKLMKIGTNKEDVEAFFKKISSSLI